MKSEAQVNTLIENFYSKTYGIKKHQTPTTRLANQAKRFDKYNLIKITRSKESESLPPALRKALNYLYPIKNYEELKPVTEYDKLVRKLSNNSLIVDELSLLNGNNKKIRLKKLSLSDIYESRGSHPHKSNSQEYIDCITYNGQAESEYMKTKEGVDEYKSLYSLILKDSGICIEKQRSKRASCKRRRRELDI